MMQSAQNYVQKLIKSGFKLSMCVSGVGTLLLCNMTRYPGSSKFFLSGRNAYSRESLQLYVQPDKINKFCSREAAESTARSALIESQHLLFASVGKDYRRLKQLDLTKCIGVGMNGSLSSDYEKKGNIQCHMAIASFNKMAAYHMLLQKGLGRQREQEIFSDGCLDLLCSFIEGKQINQHEQVQIEGKKLSISSVNTSVSLTSYRTVLLPHMLIEPPLENCALFSGSFNPFHIGHLQMVKLSEKHKMVSNRPVILEMTLKNADKKDNIEILPRLQSIVDIIENGQHKYGGQIQPQETIMARLKHNNVLVMLSNIGKFTDKKLKNGVFVIGADTFQRLDYLKFYNNDEKQRKKAIGQFIVDDVQFLVFPRNDIRHKPQLDIQYEVVDNWRMDISSTKIRQNK